MNKMHHFQADAVCIYLPKEADELKEEWPNYAQDYSPRTWKISCINKWLGIKLSLPTGTKNPLSIMKEIQAFKEIYN